MGKWTRRAFITTAVLAGGAVAIGVGVRPGDRRSRMAGLVAGEGETLLNIWVKIAPDNSITAIVPHAEMGQGVHTTLTMMLADELDADWSAVKMIEAPAAEEYANYALVKGFVLGEKEFPPFLVDTVDGLFLELTQLMAIQLTANSTSVQTTGVVAMRVAGAATRSILKQAAGNAWEVPIEELETRNSYVSHPASGRSAPYAEFAARAAELSVPPSPALKDASEFTIMGTDVQRFDVPAKVDGTAGFGIDIVLPDMKYATVKAAPVFGDTIKSIDSRSAEAMQGVRKVINLGDAVAVVADGYWQAKQALDRLSIEYEASGNDQIEQSDIYEQFVTDLQQADTNDAREVDFEIGDAEAAMSAAGKVVEAEYRVPYLAHATLEPMNCTVWVRDGTCELWTGTQNPLGFAQSAAEMLDIDIADVTVHNQLLGGGFGRRVVPDCALQAINIAAQVPYPVKLIWSREEDMRHDHYRNASISRFRAGLDETGKPTAWMNQYVDKHDPADATHVPYAINNQLVHFVESQTPVPWGYWRSVDHSLHGYFIESFIDELAIAAGKDPYRFRYDLLANEPRIQAVLDIAAEKSDWGTALPENWGRGIAIRPMYGSVVAQVIEVEIEDGKPRVRRVVCAIDTGFAIHPDGIRAQMESGIIFGLTAALYGEISIRHGAVVQSNFHNYEMLRMNESPVIETHIINSGAAIGGAGEAGTPTVAAALVNAIYDAVGIRIRELPIMQHDLRRKGAESRDVA
jgi:isoquinoline 1-oxidoreductase beta subunit